MASAASASARSRSARSRSSRPRCSASPASGGCCPRPESATVNRHTHRLALRFGFDSKGKQRWPRRPALPAKNGSTARAGCAIFTRHWEPDGEPRASRSSSATASTRTAGNTSAPQRNSRPGGFAVTALDLRGRGRVGRRALLRRAYRRLCRRDLSQTHRSARAARHPGLAAVPARPQRRRGHRVQLCARLSGPRSTG